MHIPLANITPIYKVASQTSSCPPDGTDYKELTMVLYCQVLEQDEKIKAMEADKENQTPSPTGPQPSIHLGPRWQDNFHAMGTHHYFIIPDGDQDVITPFVQYDLDSLFPELLATHGHGCTVHSQPLYASPHTSRTAFYFSHDKLLFHNNVIFTLAVDWVVGLEEDPTLAGEIQHFCLHQKMANNIAKYMGQLRDSLEVE